MQLPLELSLWSSDQCLRYLQKHGSDQPGSLIVGEEAFTKYLAQISSPVNPVPLNQRTKLYPLMAVDLVRQLAAGSSVSGEQPKFLATRMLERVPVIVKFSPPASNDIGRRYADLLVCEHLSLETIRSHGHEASETHIIQAGNRTLLEIERFDRTPIGGRHGMLSLHCLHAEFMALKAIGPAPSGHLRPKRLYRRTLPQKPRGWKFTHA